MSIEIYAFLGDDIDNLESRLIKSFRELGFAIELHPELRLLENNPDGAFYLAALATPPHLHRVRPDTPLLLSFGYSVSKTSQNARKRPGWPPRKVQGQSYEIATRTSAGRSHMDFFAQAFTSAILARETRGYFYILGEEEALSGDAALERLLGELDFCKAWELDAGAYPYQAWPPISRNESFLWPDPIESQRRIVKPRKKFKRPSIAALLTWGIAFYFIAVTFLYY